MFVITLIFFILSPFIFYFFYYKPYKSKSSQIDNPNNPNPSHPPEYTYLPLLSNEKSWSFQIIQSISTATIFQGDSQAILPFISQRVQQILELNPWLSGRYVTHNRERCIRLDPKSSTINKNLYFRFIQDFNFAFNQDQLLQNKKLLSVLKGRECRDRDEQLFKVTLIQHESNKFILFISLSHIIGDGHTYYSLYRMFHPNNVPVPLIFDRIHSFDQFLTEKAPGVYESGKLLISFKLTLCFIRSLIYNRKVYFHTRIVNKETVNQIKQKHLYTQDNYVPYISTNDILTQWSFDKYKSDIGFLFLNFRGESRMSQVSDRHVGNYEGSLAFVRNSIHELNECRATVIRSTLSNKKCLDLPGPLPASTSVPTGANSDTVTRSSSQGSFPSFGTLLRKLFNMKISVVTNWTSFYSELDFSSLDSRVIHLYHIPISFETRPRVTDHITIFNLNKETIAMLINDVGQNISGDELNKDPLFLTPSEGPHSEAIREAVCSLSVHY